MARRTFFSLHYKPDVWRAWNVRNSRIVKDDEGDEGFFDSSVFEESKKKGDENLKTFIRDGMKNSSVTCVLAGSQTWARRWVRYEIARSVIKGNGLLTVYIDGVKDKDGNTSTRTYDPLAQIALYRHNGSIYLAEWSGDKFVAYSDYTVAIPESVLWFTVPSSGTTQLSTHCLAYDFAQQDGRKNLPDWIETAAGLAGR